MIIEFLYVNFNMTICDTNALNRQYIKSIIPSFHNMCLILYVIIYMSRIILWSNKWLQYYVCFITFNRCQRNPQCKPCNYNLIFFFSSENLPDTQFRIKYRMKLAESDPQTFHFFTTHLFSFHSPCQLIHCTRLRR